MRLSIAIVNWNATPLLEACIRSIEQYPPLVEYEVIVVDNDSDDFHERLFRKRFPRVKLITNSDNVGYARGNNEAIKTSTGDCVLLLNPDTRVTEGALEALVKFMELHPDAAAAGAKLVRPDGKVERSVRSFPSPGPIAWEYIGLSRIFRKSETIGAYRMTYFTYDRTAEVDQPMASCLIVSRRALDDVGLFDEQFPIFFNDVDWLYRAKEAGYKVYFTPDAAVIHIGGGSTRQAGRRKMKKESHRSLIRFYRKHYKGKLFAPVYYFTVACIYLNGILRAPL